jgi:hypothetical protein
MIGRDVAGRAGRGRHAYRVFRRQPPEHIVDKQFLGIVCRDFLHPPARSVVRIIHAPHAALCGAGQPVLRVIRQAAACH